MYSVSEQELDTIASGGNTTHVGFLGLSLGSAVTFGITLLTASLPSPHLGASFVALFWTSVVASGYFALRAVTDYRMVARRVNAIKTERRNLPP
jgi:hypothetical protein